MQSPADRPRVLQLMVASVVLPAVLFAWASWLNSRHEHAIADDQKISRSARHSPRERRTAQRCF
jgi:hypothetical protein